MDRLKRDRRAQTLLAALLCTACPSSPKEAPPPPESLEIASAAPGALGALAGGTEAAPVVGSFRRFEPQPDDPFGLGESPQQIPDPEEEGEHEEPDAGAAPGDAGMLKRPIQEVPL
jgi:hypothetical protein